MALKFSTSPTPTISEFVAEEIYDLTCERNELLVYRDGLFDAYKNKSLSLKELKEELHGVGDRVAPIQSELLLVQKQRQAFEQDMEDHPIMSRKSRTEAYERAYTSTLVRRVWGFDRPSAAKTKVQKKEFRSSVLERYETEEEWDYAFCHISGQWWPTVLARAAHLVPKGLSSEELSYIFGGLETPATDPLNGVCLYRDIEMALDKGQIVIVPVRCAAEQQTEWKCVLVDQSIRNQIAYYNQKRSLNRWEPPKLIPVKWRQLDGKLLTFLSRNRPARRFLYFRFLMTYLNAKANDNNSLFTTTVESSPNFWAFPGAQLERSTLLALARNITGVELHAPLAANTYESVSSDEADHIGTLLAHRVRTAIIKSSQRSMEEEDKEWDSDSTEYADSDDELGGNW